MTRFLILALVFFLPSVSYGACYIGSGFSIPAVNELFSPTGDTQSGYPIYENESTGQFLFYYDGYNTYYIDDVVSAPPTNPVEYYNLTAGTNPIGAYEVSSGPSYAGDIDLGTCAGGGGGATTTFSTTTEQNTNALGIAWVLFFMSMIFTGFVWNKV